MNQNVSGERYSIVRESNDYFTNLIHSIIVSLILVKSKIFRCFSQPATSAGD